MKANKAKSQAQSAAKDAGINLPVSVPALYDNGALQTDVNFLGLGKKVERAADKVSVQGCRGPGAFENSFVLNFRTETACIVSGRDLRIDSRRDSLNMH